MTILIFNFVILCFNQIQHIKSRFEEKNMQQTEYNKLLEEEVKLLNEVQKKRNTIRKEAYEKYMDRMLDKMGAPIKWIGYKSKYSNLRSLIYLLFFKR